MHEEQTIDLTDVPESNYLDQPGIYNLAIVATENHIFKSGSTGFAIKMRDEYGRQISDRVVVTEKTLWKIKQIANAAGLTPEEQARFQHKMLIGKSVKCTCKLDDENYLRVDNYSTADAEIDAPPLKDKDDVPF